MDKRLKQAKSKYGVTSGTLVGHSLDGIIVKYISSSNDKVITLDSASIIGQTDRLNATSYSIDSVCETGHEALPLAIIDSKDR